jgi:hypothetical protein
MGTYTNTYFENEKFSINTKYLYLNDVINEYQKNKKIYFTEHKDRDGNIVYFMFDNKEWDGYKHNDKFDRCSYNFFYNADKNTLKIAVANDFYLHLHDVSNFDGDIDVFYSQKSKLLENKHFEYKGLLITDIEQFDNRIGFIYNDIQYRVWFKNNVITDIVVTDNIKDSENTFRTMDFNVSSYFTGKEIYEISKNDKIGIDFFKFILEKTEVPLLRKIVNAYENDIKQHIDILKGFLLNYKPEERIILDMID